MQAIDYSPQTTTLVNSPNLLVDILSMSVISAPGATFLNFVPLSVLTAAPLCDRQKLLSVNHKFGELIERMVGR